MRNLIRLIKLVYTSNLKSFNKIINLLIFLSFGIILSSFCSIFFEYQVDNYSEKIDELEENYNTLILLNQRIELKNQDLLKIEKIKGMDWKYPLLETDSANLIISGQHYTYLDWLKPQELAFSMSKTMIEAAKIFPINHLQYILGLNFFWDLELNCTSHLLPEISDCTKYNYDSETIRANIYFKNADNNDLEKNNAFQIMESYNDIVRKIQIYNKKIYNRKLESLTFYELSNILPVLVFDGYKINKNVSNYLNSNISLNKKLIYIFDYRKKFYNDLSSKIFLITFLIQIIIFSILQVFEIYIQRRNYVK